MIIFLDIFRNDIKTLLYGLARSRNKSMAWFPLFDSSRKLLSKEDWNFFFSCVKTLVFEFLVRFLSLLYFLCLTLHFCCLTYFLEQSKQALPSHLGHQVHHLVVFLHQVLNHISWGWTGIMSQIEQIWDMEEVRGAIVNFRHLIEMKTLI